MARKKKSTSPATRPKPYLLMITIQRGIESLPTWFSKHIWRGSSERLERFIAGMNARFGGEPVRSGYAGPSPTRKVNQIDVVWEFDTAHEAEMAKDYAAMVINRFFPEFAPYEMSVHERPQENPQRRLELVKGDKPHLLMVSVRRPLQAEYLPTDPRFDQNAPNLLNKMVEDFSQVFGSRPVRSGRPLFRGHPGAFVDVVWGFNTHIEAYWAKTMAEYYLGNIPLGLYPYEITLHPGYPGRNPALLRPLRNPQEDTSGEFGTEKEFRDYLLYEIRRLGDEGPLERSGVAEALRPHVGIELFVRAHADTPQGQRQFETYVQSLELLLKRMTEESQIPSHAHAYVILYAGANWVALADAWKRFYGGARIETERLIQTGDQLAMKAGNGSLERFEAWAIQIADIYLKWCINGMGRDERTTRLADLFRFAEEENQGPGKPYTQVVYVLSKAGVPENEISEAYEKYSKGL